MKFKQRIKQRIKQRVKQRAAKAKAKAVNAQLMGSLLSACVPQAGSFANAGQSVSSDHLFEKCADANEWARRQLAEIEAWAVTMRVMDTSNMIASALNSVVLPPKRSWFYRLFH